MKFQEFCVRQIKNALDFGLTREQLEGDAYKRALRVGMVRAYAETYYLRTARYEFVFWNLDFGAHRILSGHEVWKALLCSEQAYGLCKAMENHEGREKVCYEHIEPADCIYEKLIALNGKNPSEAAIKRILDRCKLVALTHEEMSLLDKRPHSLFTDEDEELIEQWNTHGFISNKTMEEAIKSMSAKASAKSHGTAHARLAHLVNKGVRFKWGQRPELSGGALIAAYLKDKDHNI